MEYIEKFWQDYNSAILGFVTALAFLLAVYIVARILRSVARKLMKKTSVDNKFIQVIGLKENFPVEAVVSGVIFWIVMTFGFLMFFDKLDLDTVAHPIDTFLTEIFAYLPKIGAALGLMILAWVIASVVKLTISKVA